MKSLPPVTSVSPELTSTHCDSKVSDVKNSKCKKKKAAPSGDKKATRVKDTSDKIQSSSQGTDHINRENSKLIKEN